MERKEKYTIPPQEFQSRHGEDAIPLNMPILILDNELQRATTSERLNRHNVDQEDDLVCLWPLTTEKSSEPKMSTNPIDDGAVPSTSGMQHKYVTVKQESEKWQNIYSPKTLPRDATETKDILGKKMPRNDKIIDTAKLSAINWDQIKRKTPSAVFYNTDKSIDPTQMKFEVQSSSPKKEEKILDCTERYHWSNKAEIQELHIDQIKDRILRELKRIEEMTNTFTNFRNVQLATQSIRVAIIELAHKISNRKELKERNQLTNKVIELKANIASLEEGIIHDSHRSKYFPSFVSTLATLPRASSDTGDASSITTTSQVQLKKDPKISNPPVTIKDSYDQKEIVEWFNSFLKSKNFKKHLATKKPRTAVQKKKNVKKAPHEKKAKTTIQSKIASSRAAQRPLTSTKKKEEKKKTTKSEVKKKKIHPHISTEMAKKLLKDIEIFQKKLSLMQCVVMSDSSDMED